jgi:hypothetical protein
MVEYDSMLKNLAAEVYLFISIYVCDSLAWKMGIISGNHHKSLSKSGWWFGTFFILYKIWDNPSH